LRRKLTRTEVAVRSGTTPLWMLDLPSLNVISRVTSIGNETYLLDMLPARR